jgi:hypothetical protein
MDQLIWEAVYTDGTSLCQIDDKGEKHAYADIDRANLQLFVLWKGRETTPVFLARFNNDGYKLIWRRRTIQKEGTIAYIHVVAKKDQYVALVNDSGHVQIYDNFDDNESLLCKPIPVDGEF